MRPDVPPLGVVLVAAGSGTRLGSSEPKAFVPVAGRTILERSLDGLFGLRESASIVVVAPAAKLREAQQLVKSAAGPAARYVSVVTGGDSRQASVAAGLAALPEGVDVVLVHDAARAFTPSAVFERVVRGVRRTRAGVVPALAVADTIKTTDAGTVTGTLDRSSLAAVQTPQGFPFAELVDAYRAATEEHTDDAALFAAAGGTVSVVEGDPLAFKITTPWDLRGAEAVAGATVPVRTGVGMDIHAFDESRPLWLGGVYWPAEPGLAGHSDGDALCHAVCDALLSASGLGDIGGRFGTFDARFIDAHGDVFITETCAIVRGAGYEIGNVAVQVTANRPKIASRRVEMERKLTELVGAPVSVAATTSDGLGFTGRGEGVAVIATALVYQSR
ncbi:2-C-methyl-D-erythritol 4-phosphate cytidylyltransferase [Desertivibrio insolitus]|uniref:2-C-methyl-D-erythritol 4-phosphate cytidylyltransferase n=1 Tax=Herbiconiux sp. SYSU D00978 TaxID=2812562 RepID=UPI001A96DA6F|nr:2-C-methyl-D-erythritol 4-phosphate cytidylyltransferase [Herbiconiux sp. SYSU D00978]